MLKIFGFQHRRARPEVGVVWVILALVFINI